MELRVFKMNEFVPPLVYGTKYSACFDISACLADRPSIKGFDSKNNSVIFICNKDDNGESYIKMSPRSRVLIPTGMIFNLDKEHHVKIWARSGLSVKKGLAMSNGIGIIDSDYVEEVFVPMTNNSDEELVIKHGDRIAQGEIVFSWSQGNITYIKERPTQKSDRVGGFGSTGVS